MYCLMTVRIGVCCSTDRNGGGDAAAVLCSKSYAQSETSLIFAWDCTLYAKEGQI